MALLNTVPVPLSAVHFLIHPFYNASADTHERLLTEREFIERGRPEGFFYAGPQEIEDDLKLYESLAPAYLERAASVRQDQALLTFLPFARGAAKFLDARFEPLFDNLMRGLFDLLGKRHLVFYQDVDPIEDPNAGPSVLRRLTQRGWSLPSSAASYAFGESLEHCVPGAVRNLRKGLGLRKFTHVHPLFTDLRMTWPELSEEERRSWREELRPFGVLIREQVPL